MTQPIPEQVAYALLIRMTQAMAQYDLLNDAALAFDDDEQMRIGRLLHMQIQDWQQHSAGLEDDAAFDVEFQNALLSCALNIVRDLGADWGIRILQS